MEETTTHPPESHNDPTRLPIKTYHCRFCSHLLIASSRDLLSATTPLKRRAGPPGLDHALILRLPATRSTRSTSSGSGSGNSSNRRHDGSGGGAEAAGDHKGKDQEQNLTSGVPQGKREETEQAHYTIPLSTLVPEAKPMVVRREDGFEKRVLLRCGRCRVVVGYEIGGARSGEDEDEDEDEHDDDENDDDNDEYIERKRRRDDKDRAIYLLPGSIVGTEDLGDGEGDMAEKNAVLKAMDREWMEWIK